MSSSNLAAATLCAQNDPFQGLCIVNETNFDDMVLHCEKVLFYLMYSRAACAAKMADGNDPVADLDPDRNGSSDDMDEPHCSADTPPKKQPRPQYKTKWQHNWASKY